jgi:preprotein translocase subunit SecE
MARQTRQQRKERRQQQLADGTARGRARSATQTPVRAAAEAPKPAADVAPRQRSHFLAESWAELQKVEWPGQRQVMQGTAVVIVACVIVGTYLFGLDQILKRFVQNVLLGQ